VHPGEASEKVKLKNNIGSGGMIESRKFNPNTRNKSIDNTPNGPQEINWQS